MNTLIANDWVVKADAVLAPTYARPDLLFVGGSGAKLFDAEGGTYLDMTSGVAVTALGHGSTVVSEALRKAAGGLVHTSNLFHTEPAIELAAALTASSFADRIFFANSGAESIEGAIKFSRLCGGTRRSKIVFMEGSFHGRTLGALAATDRPDAQAPFEPLPRGFVRAPWDDPGAYELIDDETAAVIVEPVQGEGGVRVPGRAWLAGLRRACDRNGALLVFDEVQTGLGRTGRLWAHEHFGVQPDMMTLAKPLAGGLPMGAVLMSERVAGQLTIGCHATTFGGGPLVASVALAVLREISQPEFLAGVRERGERARSALGRLPHVDEVRGLGLLLGAKTSLPVAEVMRAARARRLLVVPAADGVVRFLPPLNVEPDDLDEAIRRFGEAFEEVAQS